MSRPEGNSNPNLWIYTECFNHLSFLLSNVFFILALAVQILSTQKRMFLWKYWIFLCIKCLDLRETRTSNLRIHAECSNHLSCQGHTFAVPCFLTGSGGADIFDVQVNIWNFNCAWATAFIFDTQTNVLVKVPKILRQKMSRPEGNSNPQPSDSCRML